MTHYTYAQLEQLWINAGGSKALAPTMAAIAEAESSGDSNAQNASGATGLWQILGAVYPADQPNLKNPTVNAKEAVAKYKTQGLSAWVTYTTGAYKAFLNGKTTPDKNVPGATPVDLTVAHNDCLWFISYPGGNTAGWIGGIITIVGLAVLTASGLGRTKTVQQVANAASAVLPEAAAVKVLAGSHRVRQLGGRR